MPARSTPFQRLITAVHACSASKIYESAMLKDMDTGESREVDILIISHEANYQLLISIEVVEWTRKADVPWVEKMIQKHKRLPTNKLVLISKSGFTKSALMKAKTHGVETIELESALNIDWDFAIKLIGGGTFKLLEINWDCIILPIDSEKWVTPKSVDLIIFPGNNTPIQVGVLAQNLVNLPFTGETIFSHAKEDSFQDFHLELTQPGMKCKSSNKTLFEISKLCINMKTHNITKPFDFSMISLKGDKYGIGESKNTNEKFCFAMQRTSEGKTAGVIYDNNKIRTFRSYDQQ